MPATKRPLSSVYSQRAESITSSPAKKAKHAFSSCPHAQKGMQASRFSTESKPVQHLTCPFSGLPGSSNIETFLRACSGNNIEVVSGTARERMKESPIHRVEVGGETIFVVTDPDLARQILSDNEAFTRVGAYEPSGRTVAPVFNNEKFGAIVRGPTVEFFLAKNTDTSMISAEVKKLLETMGSKDGTVVAVLPHISKATEKVVLQAFFGELVGDEDEQDIHELLEKIHDMLAAFADYSKHPFLNKLSDARLLELEKKSTAALQEAKAFLIKLIIRASGCNPDKIVTDEERRRAFSMGIAGLYGWKTCFGQCIAHLLDSGYDLYDMDSEAFMQFVGFFQSLAFAGFDTTSSLLTFMSHEFSKLPPEKQEELRQSLRKFDAIFDDKKGLKEDEVLYKELYQVEGLRRFVGETLRSYPSIPFMARKVAKGDTPITFKKPGSEENVTVKLPEGATVIIDFVDMGKNPNLFEHAEVFDPERTELDEDYSLGRGNLLNFAYGKHSCTGRQLALKEAAIYLYWLNRLYVAQPDPDCKKVRLTMDSALDTEKPIQVKLSPRQEPTPSDSGVEVHTAE